MQHKAVRLSIIIVNFESGPLLRECLDSIAAETRETGYEVFVVDNASRDDSLGGADLRPYVRVIRNNTNAGFAPANNMALDLAGGEYVVLLNPDTVILDGALDRMVQFLDSHSEYGVVGPKMFDGDGSPVHFHNWTLTPLRYLAQPLLLRMHGDLGNAEVDWVGGACLMIRRVTITSIGYLDSHMFGEDMDWCLRARQHGWRVYHLALARITHYCGASAAKPEVAPGRVFVTRQSKLYYGEKHLGKLQATCFRGVFLLESLCKLPLLILRGWVLPGRDPWSRGALKGHKRLMRAILSGTILKEEADWWTFRA